MTGSINYKCPSSSNNNNNYSSPDLNYPSFIAFHNNDTREALMVEKLQRTLTNVGTGGPVTYQVKATTPTPGDFEVSVSPEILVFENEYDKRSFS
ncbi:hypothetical protein L484_020349 [Morus notabilis]|uniref:Subtilisin-like protease fibronectin type-III domain-containing protein n=1 Tax=Morus notabilis TaxID=981085 RepID=W9RQM3_9ROSA|nr:hypothetical protein L484_020349 [Morus notabilis]